MRYWVSLLVAATLVHAGGKLPLAAGGFIRYHAAAGKTSFTIRFPKSAASVLLVDRDKTVAPGTEPTKVEVIAEIPGKALIVSDTYPSAPLGMSYCQAGEERFLRVFTIAQRRSKQTLQQKIASCRDNIELADPGLEWSATDRTLHLHWLSGPTQKGQSEEQDIHLSATGAAH